MQQRSQNSGKDEKNKTDGKGKWEKKDRKKPLLAEFQGTFVLVIIKKYKLSCYNSDIKVKTKQKEPTVLYKEFKTAVNCDERVGTVLFAGGSDTLRYSIQLSICILNSTSSFHCISLLKPKMV
jgi:hypothetical protein